MLPSHVETHAGTDGAPVIRATLELPAAHAGAAAHALRVVRDVRFRNAELGSDDVLAMRDMTALVDALADIEGRGLVAPLHATVARLGVLSGALAQFAAGEHQERDGDAEARPLVFAIVDDVADLHGDAVRAALSAADTVGA